MPDDADRMRTRFDEIVEGLELELPDDLTPAEPVRPPEPRRAEVPPELEVEFDDLPDEQFYRDVEPLHLPKMAWPTTLAWVAAVGVPALLVVCTMIGVFLPRGVVLGAGFIAVAGATYLFSRLPARGRPDSPDDGAVL
ncbi:hypothetical protein [Aeromicrobium sp. Leaf350]|uniref:hypothetical protein n=1 Tax=Aeromicrobium sp. Leaf350 TaxID=2876565 RepID=UPI001E52B48C|nr:hypothetical protein [Aeromicrobium sp. Leaf350]